MSKRRTKTAKTSIAKSSQTRLVAIVALVLVILTFTAYWRTLGNRFIEFDDGTYVFANTHIQQGITPQSLRWAFNIGFASNWHPLTWISHMVDYRVFGLNPMGHHLVSLLLHVLNTVLLLLVLRRMTGSLWRSAFVAALFAVHPLHVESVAWAAERKDVLSATFWFLTMCAYVLYSEKPGIKRYLPVFFLYALGLMAKPMLVTLPLVLLLLDYWPLKRVTRWPSLILEKTPLLALSAASSVLTFLAQAKSVGNFEQVTPGIRVANAVTGYATYIWKMLWPQKLAVLYPFPQQGLPTWKPVASAILLIAISVLAYSLRCKRPYLAVGWLWFLGTLVPVIGLVQVGTQSAADRYTYVPLVGLFLAIVWTAPTLFKTRDVAPTLGILAILPLAAMTWVQVGYWRDSVSLFNHTLKCTSGNYVIENSLGLALAREGRFDEAIAHHKASLEIAPDYPQAHNNLGILLGSQGKLDEALFHFRKALEAEPDQAIMHFNVAMILQHKGKLDEAISEYRKCIQYNPNNANAYYNLGRALENQGKPGDAAKCYRSALDIDPAREQASKALERLGGK